MIEAALSCLGAVSCAAQSTIRYSRKSTLERKPPRELALPFHMAQVGASLRKAASVADEVVGAIAPHVGDRLIVVLPYLGHDYVRVIYGDCEARVRREKPGYLYEIVSRNVVLARGEKGSAYTALERSTSLLVMLKASGVRWRAA